MHTGSAPESPGITPLAIHMGVHIHPVPSLMCTWGMFQPDTTLHEQTHIPLVFWPWVGPPIIAVNSKGHLEFLFCRHQQFLRVACGWATQEDAALPAVPTLLVSPSAQRPCWAQAGVCRAWGMLLPTQAPSRGTGDPIDAQEAVSLAGRWGSTLSQEEGLSPPSHCLHSCSRSRFAFVGGGRGADTCPWPP